MKKKLLMGVLALSLSFGALGFFSGCSDEVSPNGNSESSSNADSSDDSSSNDPNSQKVFEGEMLLNGFETIDDLYKIKHYEAGNNGGTAKFDIVGEEDWLISDSEETIAEANQALAALPTASSITEATNELKALASKARALYSSLTVTGKNSVTGADNLEAVLEKLGMNDMYTLGELRANSCLSGNDLRKGFANAGTWYSACADLPNLKEGTVAFTVTGINSNAVSMPNHGLQICLFHDNSIKTVTDGIYMRLDGNTKQIYFKLAGGGSATMPLLDSWFADAMYTFKVSYKVADDYSKVTIAMHIVDELDNIVCNSTIDIDAFTTSNYGDQTVANWLNGEDKKQHTGLLIDTGTSSGVTVKGLWEGYSYEESTTIVRDQSDLAPVQGEKALRLCYDQGKQLQHILARFSRSDLAGLPAEKLGGMSIQIYNDNAETKEITFSIMRDYGEILDLGDEATFELAPYEWTTCKFSFDPNVIEQYANDIVGVNVEFSDKNNCTYYLDNWKVSFDQAKTEEQEAAFATVFNLKTTIAQLYSKTITTNDAAEVKELYDTYMGLEPAYKDMLSDYEVQMKTIYQAYNHAVYAVEASNETFTLIPFDEYLGLTCVEKGISLPEGMSYSNNEKSPNGNGSLAVDLSDASIVSGVNIALADATYDELHIWVKNTSTSKVTVKFSNRVLYDYNGTAYDEDGNEVIGTYVSKFNEIVSSNVYDGWIRLVYRDYAMVSNVTITQGDGMLYIGKIYGVSHVDEVIRAISSLQDYMSNYTDEQKAEVLKVREQYETVAFVNKDKVTNRAKLFTIQANIWKEDYDALNLPTDVSNLAYDENLDVKIDELMDSYEGFEDSGKAIIATQYEKLQTIKARYEALAEEYNDGIITLRDAGIAEYSVGSWQRKSGSLSSNALQEAFFFRMTQRSQLGTGVFYVTLFYGANAQINEGDGIGFVFSNSTVKLGATTYTLAEKITADMPYLIKVGYDIASDYSSMKVNIQVTKDDGSDTMLVNATETFTSISGSSIRDWVDAHRVVSIASGQCSFEAIENAWDSLRVTRLQQVSEMNTTFASLDDETLGELTALKENYNAMPTLYRMMVVGLDRLEEKIDDRIFTLRDNAYTPGELGLTSYNTGTWAWNNMTLKNATEGTIIFKVTPKSYSNSSQFYLVLFGDVQTTNTQGLAMHLYADKLYWKVGYNGTVLETDGIYGFTAGTEYCFAVSYKITGTGANSSVAVSVKAISTTDGKVMADCEYTFNSTDSLHLDEWAATHNTFDIYNCTWSFTSQTDAWDEIDVEKLQTIQDLETSISNLTGAEELTALNELKAIYDALPLVYQLMVDNYADLESAIASKS